MATALRDLERLAPPARRGLRRGRRRRGLYRRRWRPSPADWALMVLGLVIAWFGFNAWRATFVGVSVTGVADGAVLTPGAAEGLRLVITTDPTDRITRAEVTLNGRPVEDDATEVRDGRLIWRPTRPLGDGTYELAVSVPRPVMAATTVTRRFTIDGRAPSIVVPPLLDPQPIDAPVTIVGRADPDAELTVAGEPVEVDPEGVFRLRYPHPPTGPILLKATDAAGNETVAEVLVPVRYPADAIRAVHVTAVAWRHPQLRAHIDQLITEGRINAVELDLKDEGGVIGYDSALPFHNEIGAVRPEYDLAEAVEWLHARGVRVIGRIVAFRDPVLAAAAWDRGDTDWVIQNADGTEPFSKYGGFTNYVHPGVRDYNLQVALEAADAGVDDILWDYIRRPDGDPATMRVPGLRGFSADAVAEFLAQSSAELRARGVYVGVSVFGIAADRPNTIAQHIPTMARYADYIAPMVYPSHWVPGEYGVDDPNGQPYDIVRESLKRFQEAVEGTGAFLVPWLQDFSLGRTYGEAEVRAQIRAAADLGIDSFFLWNARVRYTVAALDPGYLDAHPGWRPPQG